MAGVFDHLHIKRHTAGSSNELSFDVLDAARSGLDGKKSRSSRTPGTFKPSQGSYHGVTGTATLSGQPEVEKRKRARRVHSIRLGVVGVCFVLFVAFAMLWFGYRHYLDIQDFSMRFGTLVDKLAEQDESIAKIDALVQGLDDAETAEEKNAALQLVEGSLPAIERIRENAEGTMPLAISEEDGVAISQVVETCEARQEMLEAAQVAFELDTKRAERARQADEIWAKVVTASQDAREAAAQSNSASTEAEIRAAQEKTRELEASLVKTGRELEAFAKEQPALDLSAELEYLAAKERSLGYAVETADALVAGDRSTAAEKNDAYNAADREAAEIAKKLPLSIDEAVDAAYAPQLDACAARYETARNRAIAADALIREYVG